MTYYKIPARSLTGYCVIQVVVRDDFTAYIKSCTSKSVRYAYTRLSAKPFDSYEQASRYIEKNRLLKRFSCGCRIVTVPASEKKSA